LVVFKNFLFIREFRGAVFISVMFVKKLWWYRYLKFC